MLVLILCVVFTHAAYSQVIFQEDFAGTSGAAGSLNGTAEDFAGATWTANGFATASGLLNVGQFEGSAVLDFTASTHNVYTVSLDVETVSDRWIGLGFSEGGSTGVPNRPQDRFAQAPGNGVAWFIYRPGTANLAQQVEIFGGLNTGNGIPDNDLDFSGALTNRTLEVILDTTADLTGDSFQADFLIDGVSVSGGPQTVSLDISNINHVGFTFEGPNGGTGGANPPITIDNFTFSKTPGPPPAPARLAVSLDTDHVIDTQALLFPQFNGSASGGGLFGRSPNGVAHQTSPLVTFGSYQYAAWYRFGADEDIILGRRSLLSSSSAWESFDTGLDMIRGDAFDNDKQFGPTQTQPWDTHNAVNIGISGDGRLHMAYDHHSNILRYIQGDVNGSAWDRLSVFGTTSAATVRDDIEQDSFIDSDPLLEAVTYPRFATNPVTGDLVVTYRLGQSGSGNLHIANYSASSGTWSAGREFITGNDGVAFNDFSATGITNTSTSRNPYLNNITFAQDGSLHASFTWRETANGTANHNINYISSDDGGLNWLNDSGDLIAVVGQTVSILSAGIIAGSETDYISPFVAGGSSTSIPEPLGLIDRRQTLINQQGQTVDSDGGVHILMWSRENESTYDSGDFTFDSSEAAYFHYYRDPVTGDWTRNQIPREDREGNRVDVGSRGQIAFDSDGNAFAAFVSPGVANPNDSRNYLENGSLVIAGATKGGDYQDWSILYQDSSTIFEGEPLIDQERLRRDGVLSVFLQETSSNTSVTGSNMHVFDFDKALLGDVNRDGVVDFLDISPFIILLAAGDYQLEADMDQNGMVDFLDISPFIGVLSSN